MRITPLDIRKQEFRKTMRGLDGDEVYAFLTTVADEYEAVLSDNKRIRERIVELEERLQEYRGIEKNLRNTLLTAERVTSEAKENAHREAGLIVREAEMEAEQAAASIRAHTQQLRGEVLELKKQKDNYLTRMKTLIESHRKVLDGFEEDFAHADEEIERIGERVVEDAERAVTPPRMSREKITEPFGRETTDKVTWGDERKREEESRPVVPPPGWDGSSSDRKETGAGETMSAPAPGTPAAPAIKRAEASGRPPAPAMDRGPAPNGHETTADVTVEETLGGVVENEARRIVQHSLEEKLYPGLDAADGRSMQPAPRSDVPGYAPLAGVPGGEKQPRAQEAAWPGAAEAPGAPLANTGGPAPAENATAVETQAPLQASDDWKQYEVRDARPDWKDYEIPVAGNASPSTANDRDNEVEEALSTLTEAAGAATEMADRTAPEAPAPPAAAAPSPGTGRPGENEPKEDAESTWSMEELRRNLSTFGRDD